MFTWLFGSYQLNHVVHLRLISISCPVRFLFPHLGIRGGIRAFSSIELDSTFRSLSHHCRWFVFTWQHHSEAGLLDRVRLKYSSSVAWSGCTALKQGIRTAQSSQLQCRSKGVGLWSLFRWNFVLGVVWFPEQSKSIECSFETNSTTNKHRFQILPHHGTVTSLWWGLFTFDS